jgi:hypothetical protein
MDDGVDQEVSDAIGRLKRVGFLRPRDHCDTSYIRTVKPPRVAHSVPGNSTNLGVRTLKQIADDREMLRGDITDEVVNAAYAEGPTL